MIRRRSTRSLKSLFQTGLFSDVRIFRRGGNLVVVVEENPMINRVNFEGNSEVKDKDLEKEVELKERTMYTRAKVQSDVQRIIAVYRRSGYYSARVEPKIIRLPQNRIDLVYEINEGAETKVKSITFVGNEAFSDSDLRAQITTTEHAWWKFMSTSDRYDPDRLNYDKELLRRFYLKNGFADFRVISADAELSPDGESFYITFTVEEGPLYTVNSVAVNRGDTNLDEEQLRNAVQLSPGEDYDATKVDKSVENITIEAGKSGYAFAKVEPDIKKDEPNRKLDITYNITEGPRTYIERIDIIGNTRTLDEVIRRELRLYEGDAYNRVLVERGRRRLTALDFFEKIDMREEPGSAPDKVVLIVEVVEKSTGSLNLTAGYSTSDGIIGGISITERNLLGRGQNVRLDTQLSWDRQQVDFSFTEPYFLDMPLSAGFDLFATNSSNTDTTAYDSTRYGGALRTGFRLDEWQSLSFKYMLARRDITIPDDADVSPAILDSEGVTWKSAVTGAYVYDDLDNPSKPSKGFRGKGVVEIAGLGGDVYYASIDTSAYYFMPLLFDGVVLKLEANAGYMVPTTSDDIPIQDRFFKGSDTFRGFKRGGVGPRMDNTRGDSDAIGGQTYAIGTVETTFPLGLPEEFGLEGAVFSDFGTVFDAPENTVPAGTDLCPPGPDADECKVHDTPAFRLSVGAGLIWQSPFGPLRVDVAYPLLKASYDEEELFRFSVGTRF
ncbi:outer membrane protein assembly factor BamA [Nordella sp. HKS 07]|uniref:outer membrane protein assembly factor BamA n=1 Tax=Nordella sp. HKS 07 TaxID=2712222 RepID=UPI0013E1E5FE|nr:outer membrane protein assembly factor BamA [Nordella sp. HKS 07]QIG51216.1 outer membrane protein assembly factor BamA [Nordella sp. HKS 07]